jgi:hypothetical protein
MHPLVARLLVLVAGVALAGSIAAVHSPAASAKVPRFVLQDDHQGTWPPCGPSNDGAIRLIDGGLYECTAYWDPQYRVWIYYWKRVTCGSGKAPAATPTRGEHRRWTSHLERHGSWN